jgi:hypothetical protein
MKKVYGLFILLFLSKFVSAQETTDAPGFKAALRVTPIFMWTKVDVDDATKYTATNNGLKLGFAYGIMGDFFFNENYAFSIELRHALENAGFTVTDKNSGSAGIKRDYTLHLQYVEVPLTFKMQTKEIGYMRYYGQFGFMPSIRVKAKEDLVVTDLASTVATSIDNLSVADKVNLFDLGLVIGGGTTYNLGGSTSLLGGLSFHNGFTNLVKEKEYNAKVKPAYVALNLGVIF